MNAPIHSVSEGRPARGRARMPHIYVILLAVVALAAGATYLVPAGAYDLVPGPQGREVVDPDSFHLVERAPLGPVALMTAIPRGLVDAAEVVVFTLLIGGVFMVLRATGIIDLGVGRLARLLARRGLLVVPLLMIPFATIATLIGTPELSLVYIPVILPLLLRLGFDSVTAAAVALCSTAAGFTAGVTNPVTVGLAQEIADVPLYSGLGLRTVLFVCVVAAAVLFVTLHAARVRRDPERSPVRAEDESRRAELADLDDGPPEATPRRKAGILVLAGFVALLLYGVLALGWFLLELSGLFLVMGVTVGLVAGLGATRICDALTDGMRDVLLGAMVVGVARAVAVVLEDGRILDTIVHGLASAAQGVPPVLAPLGMLLVQATFNFVVPSGSGQAVIMMPIMAPLADILGTTRQTAVLAFQIGDGFANVLYPTSGYFMACLALARVPWITWVRFVWPLMLTWLGIGATALSVAHATGWGPV
ncbi:YfcC family protein [Nocardiopsis sp. MG754419]|uniref:YfcC family protein n=1 Tax=Nocardiopsis sp. MG754419 TaxID=2259865 RepID=UPI001BAD6786|nr:Na+/H+ antiporter NhaC family protein [Nocardiopsis sp. MG754419]MBR8742278.1 YfcC family protein [Nocardiopsis sp. MG754419]